MAGTPAQPLRELSSHWQRWQWHQDELTEKRALLHRRAVEQLTACAALPAELGPTPSLEDLQTLLSYWAAQIAKFCTQLKLRAPLAGTALAYFQRYYLRHSPLTSVLPEHSREQPKLIMYLNKFFFPTQQRLTIVLG